MLLSHHGGFRPEKDRTEALYDGGASFFFYFFRAGAREAECRGVQLYVKIKPRRVGFPVHEAEGGGVIKANLAQVLTTLRVSFFLFSPLPLLGSKNPVFPRRNCETYLHL